ncbi:15170_t:CDS:1, partial [Cetraspora pellucida]
TTQDENITVADSSINEDLESLDPFFEHFSNESQSTMQYENEEDEDDPHDNLDNNLDDNLDDNGSKVLRYDLDEMQEVTKKIFEETELLDEVTSFTYEIKIEDDLLAAVSLMPLDLIDKDLDIIESNFCQLAHTLIVPLESGSNYYWEICKTYLNK